MRTKLDRLLETIHTLECFYYLVQELRTEGREHIRKLKYLATTIPKDKHHQLIMDVRKDIGRIRRETECIMSDDHIRQFVQQMASGAMGYVNIPKWYIDRNIFKKYDRVFPRWPHIPLHALIQFETQIEGDSPKSILVVEAMLFDDVEMMWRQVLRILNDGLNFRTRSKEIQRELQTYMRAALTGAYRFLEAYLNGLAYDCFQMYHDTMDIADHDLLAEWDSKKKLTRYVSFERKLRIYPKISGEYLGRTVDLSADPDVDTLLVEGKALRDGLTHPSPFVDPRTQEFEKVVANIAIQPGQIKQILLAAFRYTKKVESFLGRNPSKSIPWLQFDFLEDAVEQP